MMPGAIICAEYVTLAVNVYKCFLYVFYSNPMMTSLYSNYSLSLSVHNQFYLPAGYFSLTANNDNIITYSKYVICK